MADFSIRSSSSTSVIGSSSTDTVVNTKTDNDSTKPNKAASPTPEFGHNHDSNPEGEHNYNSESEDEFVSDVGSNSSGSSSGGDVELAALLTDDTITAEVTHSSCFAKDTDENVEQFMRRIIGSLSENDNWKITTSNPSAQPSLDQTNMENFYDDATKQVELHFPGKYDIGNVEKGSPDPHLASQSIRQRRIHLRTAFIDVGKAHNITRGKWILPVDNHLFIQEYFLRIATWVENDLFGTAVDAAWYPRLSKGVIFIWIDDHSDEEKMWNVILGLWMLGISDKAYFKPEVFTALKLRTHNIFGVRIVEYTSHDYYSSM